jgi:hypothetical protein
MELVDMDRNRGTSRFMGIDRMAGYLHNRLPPAAAFLLALAAGCADAPTQPEPAATAHLVVQSRVAGTPIRTMTVEITAPDIVVPLVFNLEIVDGVAFGTLTLPAGSGRSVAGRAFDGTGTETHRGSRSLAVSPGLNEPVTIALLPLQGEQSVELVLASYSVKLEPAHIALAIGVTERLSAAVRDADGVTHQRSVHWATTDPAVATVDATGLVTARGPGAAGIVAVFAGVAALADVVVTEP